MASENDLPPVKIAFIIDGEVVDILHTDERLSAIFTSNPIIKNVTGQLVTDNGVVEVGAKYNNETDEFIAKEEILNKVEDN